MVGVLTAESAQNYYLPPHGPALLLESMSEPQVHDGAEAVAPSSDPIAEASVQVCEYMNRGHTVRTSR